MPLSISPLSTHAYALSTCAAPPRSIAANVVPLYNAELAPAPLRGAVVNIYQAIQIVGVIISTIAVYKLNTRTDDLAWQLCIGLQFVAPTLLLAGVWFMPESPRYLVFQGKHDEARKALEFLNAGVDGFSADGEIATLSAAFEHEKAIQKPSVLAVFKGSDRRRALIAVGVMCLQQAQGSSYSASSSPRAPRPARPAPAQRLTRRRSDQLHRPLPDRARHDRRLQDRHGPLVRPDRPAPRQPRRPSQADALSSSAPSCLYLAAILCSFYLPDRFGRRPMLMLGALVCATALTITCGINVGYGDAITSGAQKAGLAMVFIWYVEQDAARLISQSESSPLTLLTPTLAPLRPPPSSLSSPSPRLVLASLVQVLHFRPGLVAARLDHLLRGLLGPSARADPERRHFLGVWHLPVRPALKPQHHYLPLLLLLLRRRSSPLLAIAAPPLTPFRRSSPRSIITLVSPYIQDPGYGNLGASIGFIWAGFTWLSIPFVYFFVPEMKGASSSPSSALVLPLLLSPPSPSCSPPLSPFTLHPSPTSFSSSDDEADAESVPPAGLTLEQIDVLFDSKTPTRRFGAAQLFLDDEAGAARAGSGKQSLKDEDDQ